MLTAEWATGARRNLINEVAEVEANSPSGPHSGLGWRASSPDVRFCQGPLGKSLPSAEEAEMWSPGGSRSLLCSPCRRE